MAKQSYEQHQPNPHKTRRHKTYQEPNQIPPKCRSITAQLIGSTIVLCFFFLLGAVPVAVGQTPDESPLDVPGVSQLEDFELPTIGDLLTPVGNYINSAPVRLDGRTLFRVASTENISAEVRAAEIQRRLEQFTTTEFDQDTLDVDWVLDDENGPPIIYINDEYFLFTVTSLDAQLSDLSNPEKRAEDLSQTIEKALLNYRQERQPEFIQQQAKIAGIILLCMSIGSVVLAKLQYWLYQRKARAHKRRHQR